MSRSVKNLPVCVYSMLSRASSPREQLSMDRMLVPSTHTGCPFAHVDREIHAGRRVISMMYTWSRLLVRGKCSNTRPR
jgi:hypothetical protein